MSPAEEGHYIRLCAICWKQGSIPSDPEEVQGLLKERCETLEKVLKCFYKNPKNNFQLLHKRLEKERKKQRAWKKKCAKGGRKSKKPKKLEGENKDKGTLTNPISKTEVNGNTLSLDCVSNSNSNSKDKTRGDSLSNIEIETVVKPLTKNETWKIIKEQAFEKRWKEYQGKKDGRKASIGHWNASIKKYEDIQKYDSALENYREDVRFERNNGFPGLKWKNGSTWFNNWQDYIGEEKEPEEPAEPPKPRIPGDPVLEEFWNKTLEKIKPKVGDYSYLTWFEYTYPRSLSNGTLVISVPNQFVRKSLIENYRGLIESTLSDIRGSPILADFCVAG